MARLKGSFVFTGKLGNINAYTMKGSDKVILRTNGGASKEKIKKSPSFARTRSLNNEWKGCTLAGSNIQKALFPIKHLADFNITGTLNAIAKKVQAYDTEKTEGQRDILFSKYTGILEGFSLNKKSTFESIVKRQLICSLSRIDCTAKVLIPSLIPKINIYNPSQYSFFRFIVHFSLVPDLIFNNELDIYDLTDKFVVKNSGTQITDWCSVNSTFDECSLELCLNETDPLPDSYSLILSAGIEFGTPITNMLIEPIKDSGCAKILASI